MAAIKSYTDLPQSKKLMEFLPPESADMHYIIMGDDEDPQSMVGLGEYIGILPTIPCWSLAALLGILPSVIKRNGKRMFLTMEKAGAYNLYYKSPDRLDELWQTKEEPVDACVAMIEKLHEEKLF